MANANQVLAALRLQPFRAVTISLADQRSFTITHPEWAAISPNGREMIVYDESGGANFLDLRLITGIYVPGAPAEANESGSR
jgi:hypothetical protein